MMVNRRWQHWSIRIWSRRESYFLAMEKQHSAWHSIQLPCRNRPFLVGIRFLCYNVQRSEIKGEQKWNYNLMCRWADSICLISFCSIPTGPCVESSVFWQDLRWFHCVCLPGTGWEECSACVIYFLLYFSCSWCLENFGSRRIRDSKEHQCIVNHLLTK